MSRKRLYTDTPQEFSNNTAFFVPALSDFDRFQTILQFLNKNRRSPEMLTAPREETLLAEVRLSRLLVNKRQPEARELGGERLDEQRKRGLHGGREVFGQDFGFGVLDLHPDADTLGIVAEQHGCIEQVDKAQIVQ